MERSGRSIPRRVGEEPSSFETTRKIPDNIFAVLRRSDEKKALEKTLKANLTKEQMERAFVVASRFGRLRVVQGLDINGLTQRAKDLSLLLSAGYGHDDLCNFWLDNSANIEATTGRHKNRPVHMAARHKHSTTVLLLGRGGADMQAADNYHFDRPIHVGVLTGDEPTLDAVLSFREVDVNAATAGRLYQTGLHLAACYDLVTQGEKLIEHDADLNKPDALGRYPLDIAHMKRSTRMRTLLRENGAERSDHIIVPKRSKQMARWEVSRTQHYEMARGE